MRLLAFFAALFAIAVQVGAAIDGNGRVFVASSLLLIVCASFLAFERRAS